LQVWRLLDVEFDDAVSNLSVEEAIMEKVSGGEAPDTIRFWRIPSITVVVGRFQIPEFEVNREACRKYGVTVVRRFTGGGAVYHDSGNLNYTIAVRRSNPILPTMIAEIPPTLCKGVVEGSKVLGLNADFEPKGVYIHINGKKISGTATIVRRTAAFMHGTLLVNSDLKKLREILDVPPYPSEGQLRRFVKSVRKEVTSLQAELGRKVTVEEVKEALKKGFAKALNVKLERGELLQCELELAKKIATEKHDETIIYSPHP